MVLKTNNSISLVYFDGNEVYNPEKGSVDIVDKVEKKYPCFINFQRKSTSFAEYGLKEEVLMNVRFLQAVKPFKYALYMGEKYYPIDSVFNGKESYTLRKGTI